MDTSFQIDIIKLNAQIPNGWRPMKYQEGHMYKEEIMKLLKPHSIVAFDHGKLGGAGYGNEFQIAYGPECGERVIIKNQPKIVIIPLQQQVPLGYRIMFYQEAGSFKNEINELLTPYSIVAFDQGKLDGTGYGNKFSPQYGPECGEKVCILIYWD